MSQKNKQDRQDKGPIA